MELHSATVSTNSQQGQPAIEGKSSRYEINVTPQAEQPEETVAPPPYEVNVRQPQYTDPHLIPYNQQQTGHTILLLQPQAESTNYVDNWFTLSVISCLVCFPPTGILAIVMSCLVDSSLANGDYTKAKTYSKRAKYLSITSIVCGAIIFGLSLISLLIAS